MTSKEINMKNVYKIRIASDDKTEFFNVLFASKGIPECEKKYFVRSPLGESPPSDLFQGISQFQINDSSGNFLGNMVLQEMNEVIVVTFNANNDIHRKVLSKYIKQKIEEMKSAGININKIHKYSKPEDNSSNNEKPYFPSTKAALKKWRISYDIICKMREEAVESDNLEIYVPKLRDFHDRIKSDVLLHYSDRTISRIIKAGDEGFLK